MEWWQYVLIGVAGWFLITLTLLAAAVVWSLPKHMRAAREEKQEKEAGWTWEK